MRKRGVFKDFVQLAADTSGRQAYLYVLGDRPARFLRTTKANAGWGLDRAPSTRRAFADEFGPLATPISSFVAAQADRIRIVDLEQALPELFG